MNQNKVSAKKTDKQKLVAIGIAIFLVLTHVAIILAIILSFRYYAIYPSLFGSIVGIVICLLIIVDIVFFVGFNYKDLALKIISIILATFLFIGGSIGTYFIAKANGIINSVLDSSPNATKYEIFSGTFVCFDKNKTYSELKDLHDQRIGFVTETSDGITSIAENILKKEKIEYDPVYFKTNTELVQALIDTDIDVMVLTSAYRNMYSAERDENSPFAKYLDNFVDFYSFEKELKINTERKTKNLSKDPFNVLLIGYSRTDIGSPIGLADSIIVASINPQTYTVSMMSIARDSFVPIACYGGEYDKINSGRSTSRACFIETVENFIGMDIDYYMELDYLGLVSIVDAIGGIHINNPVEFELDGIYVPAGEKVFADGQMALQFCRERHHMPNGDFDRQQHQKEVIIEIAKTFVRSGDISLALNAMQEAADFMSTDLTLDQLTSIFNLILNTKNYTTLETFRLIDFQTLRITGNGGLMYYSYSMNLPLWVYLIYQGSYDESIAHMKEVLGDYSTIKQDKNFEFSCQNLYDRPLFYSLEYEDKFMFTPDPMPAYWPDLEGMTLEEAMTWASTNGVSLSVGEVISAADSRYNPNLEGLVCDQSIRYGSLVSEYSVGTITVMGAGNVNLDDYYVPDFIGKDVSKVISWARDHDIEVSGYGDITEGRVVSYQNPEPGTPIKDVKKIKVQLKEPEELTVQFNAGDGSVSPTSLKIYEGSSIGGDMPIPELSGYIFDGWYTSKTGGTKVSAETEITASTTLYAHWIKIITITLNENYDGGSITPITIESSLPSPTRVHYIFDGWYTDKTAGSEVTDLTTLTTDTTLYAHWTELQKVNYKFVVDGNTVSSGQVYSGETPDTPSTPTKTNYVFNGWSPTIGSIESDTTFEATWVEDTEEVDCDDPSGCTLDGDSIETENPALVGTGTKCTKVQTVISKTLISCSCDVYVLKQTTPPESTPESPPAPPGPDSE